MNLLLLLVFLRRIFLPQQWLLFANYSFVFHFKCLNPYNKMAINRALPIVKCCSSFLPASQLYNYSVQSEIYNHILLLHNWKLTGVFLKDHRRMSKHFLSYIILCNWVYSNLKESNKICTTRCPLNSSTMQFVRHYQKFTAEHSCSGNTEATIKFRLIIRWPSRFFKYAIHQWKRHSIIKWYGCRFLISGSY